MLETMYADKGVGLAAPQVGVTKRIIVVDDKVSEDGTPGPNPRFLVNPEIIRKSEDTIWFNEGCLSVPGQCAEVERHRAVTVRYLDYDGKEQTLDAEDYTEPALSARVTAGSKIEVHRVEYQDKVETQAVPYDTEYVYTSLYFRNTGRATTMQHGAEGQQTVTTRERWVDGELENSVVTDVTTTVEPTDHVVKTYGAGAPVSPLTGPDGTTNAPASYSKVLTGKATGYYSKSGKGSSGLGLGYGTVAVDPSVIPYGTLLYITSPDGSFVYGYAVATDTGIAVQDGRILVDLFYETYAESVINGAINVNVYVVG